MAIGDLPIFSALKARMQWHQSRQTLLAENIANAEPPGYRGRDLTPFAYSGTARSGGGAALVAQATHARHIPAAATPGAASGVRPLNSFEITPNGNGVTLEDEMMKLANNQMDYQAATTLYSRSMRLISTALGRRG